MKVRATSPSTAVVLGLDPRTYISMKKDDAGL
jgi:hypothetical protein